MLVKCVCARPQQTAGLALDRRWRCLALDTGAHAGADGVDIGTGSDLRGELVLLRRGESRCHHLGFLQADVIEVVGGPEIEQQGIAARTEVNVGWLYVEVQITGRMQGFERLQEWWEDRHQEAGAQSAAAFAQVAAKVFARFVVHRQVSGVIGVEAIAHPHDVGMVQLRQDQGLAVEQTATALEAGPLLRVVDTHFPVAATFPEGLGEVFLDRDLLVGLLVLRQVDKAEAASSDQFQNPETVQDAAGGQGFTGIFGHRVALSSTCAALFCGIYHTHFSLNQDAGFAMIRSMTAFARRQSKEDFGELTWEVRSVNHRFLESNVRLPEELRAIEQAVRDRLRERLARGKVECGLRFQPDRSAAGAIRINEVLVKQLLESASAMMKHLHSSPLPTIMDIMRWPGVLETAEQDFTPVQHAAVAAFDAVLDDLVQTREREGKRLAELILQRVGLLREQVRCARELMPAVIQGVRERLAARLAEVSENLDQERLEQEMALLAQRLDVDEEMDRLSTHLDEVERVVASEGSGEAVGRRLDFLMQELNREANTLGSKSNSSDVTRVSVEMKVLIEQMREQIQNIE